VQIDVRNVGFKLLKEIFCVIPLWYIFKRDTYMAILFGTSGNNTIIGTAAGDFILGYDPVIPLTPLSPAPLKT
jgi:hypothetical protein